MGALLEGLGHTPAHVAGTSFGASVVLGLAARRPELFRSIAVHESPPMEVLADGPAAMEQLQPAMVSIAPVLDHLRKAESDLADPAKVVARLR
ncbi:alpha/beta fold hydrolase [Streptomyces antimycoticus]|uniref:alpha/beta fold hydrolase n=1 Tax=Streptomyces antimycoticus TaxID=68175 RepID=UPI0010F78A16|nr:hypothetical protein [Streptomyces antimycoticus]